MRCLVLIAALFFIFSCGENKKMQFQSSDNPPDDKLDNFSDNLDNLIGIDYKGNQRTCTQISADINCTFVFTESDQFKQQCEAEGYKAIACACHDWICIR